MKNERCTYILIIADGNMDKLERTMDSILKQTIDRELLRVLIIDNASQDGTYSSLLDYEIKYPKMISILREKKATTRGRLLKHMVHHLRYAEVENSMILNPGDIIYPNFIKNARVLLQLQGGVRCLVCEVDIWDGKDIRKQIPIYTGNCVLEKLCEDVYYKHGIGHKIQMVYRGLPIGLSTKLPYYEVVVKCHEWLAAAYWRNSFVLYMKECGGCIYKEELDVKRELIEWAFFIKRNLYAIETQVFSTKSVLDVEKEVVETAYNCLAAMALRYAVQMAKEGLFQEAEDALVFAEMMDLDIDEDNRYLQLHQAILDERYDETLEELFEAKSETPPRVCFQF